MSVSETCLLRKFFICWNYWERFIIFPYSFDMYKNWSYNLTSLSNTANLYLVSIIDWRCFQNSCVKLYPSVVLGWGLWKVIGFRGGLEGWASCGRVSAFKRKRRSTRVVTFTYVRTQWEAGQSPASQKDALTRIKPW